MFLSSYARESVATVRLLASVMISFHDISMRTIVDLPEEQMRRLALLCRKEKISRTEAVRRAVSQFLGKGSSGDLRSFFGASKTKGRVSRHVARLRDEWEERG